MTDPSTTSVQPEPPVGRQKSWLPTRKWWAATITALGAIAVLWIQEGALSMAVGIALVGAVVQALITYVLPNDDTPGGVPLRAG
jgi:hypothetical protein